FFYRLQPGHHRAQIASNLFDLVVGVLTPHGEELLAAVGVLVEPALCEAPVLDLRQHLPHGLAHVVVDDAWSGNVVAELGSVGDRVPHEAETDRKSTRLNSSH